MTAVPYDPTRASFPFAEPPPPGHASEVAPGLLWLRFPLPFRLNHVNVYLIEDRDGWLLVDAGPGDPPALEIWATILDAGAAGPLRGRPITRILATHHHPDHVGAVADLARRTGASLLMGETEYLTALLLLIGDEAVGADVRTAFYRRHGLSAAQLETVAGHLARYRALVPDLPKVFSVLRDGDVLKVGARRLVVIEAPGHASAQMLLHSPSDNILLAADHVLTRITPNVGVTDRNPDDDPLGRFLASLATLRAQIPDGGLVLPGHHLPFRHLHARIGELDAHHAGRCQAIEAVCTTDKGKTVAELVPTLFPFSLDPHQFWFAFSEVLAHVNFLSHRGRLEGRDSHGRRRWGQIGRASHAG